MKTIKKKQTYKEYFSSDETNGGAQIYGTFGAVFALCGVASGLLLLFVSFLPQDYEKYNIPLAFGIWAAVSAALFALGATLFILSKKSKRFRRWAEKEVVSFGIRMISKDRNMNLKL